MSKCLLLRCVNTISTHERLQLHLKAHRRDRVETDLRKQFLPCRSKQSPLTLCWRTWQSLQFCSARVPAYRSWATSGQFSQRLEGTILMFMKDLVREEAKPWCFAQTLGHYWPKQTAFSSPVTCSRELQMALSLSSTSTLLVLCSALRSRTWVFPNSSPKEEDCILNIAWTSWKEAGYLRNTPTTLHYFAH